MQDVDFTLIKTLDSVDVRGKRVLVRADLNVPVENGKVADATRIKRILPTLNKLVERGSKVVRPLGMCHRVPSHSVYRLRRSGCTSHSTPGSCPPR